jgi:Protein of unknown function (DUF4058)
VAMIFPGMDPYLEDPFLWQGFHNSFVVYLRDQLQPLLGQRYIAAVEERVFVEGPERAVVPDVLVKRTRPSEAGAMAVATVDADEPVVVRVESLEIHESYVEILDRKSGQRVVTVIELVSPTNKMAGPGRDSYVNKQREILASQTHLVEIDLLRGGQHVLAVPQWATQDQLPYDYLVSVNRARDRREEFDVYAKRLQDRLPKIRVPLADDDPDVALDLQSVLAQAYEMGRYGERLNYQPPCQPPLTAEQREWVQRQLVALQGGTP